MLVHGWLWDVAGCQNYATVGESGEKYFKELVGPLRSQFGTSNPLWAFTYPTFYQINKSGTELAAELTRLITTHQLSGVIIVAHSMGGLVSRVAAQQLESDPTTRGKLLGIITLGTPHLGTPVADPASSLADYLPAPLNIDTPGARDLIDGLESRQTEEVPLYASSGDIRGVQSVSPLLGDIDLLYATIGIRSDGVVPTYSASPAFIVKGKAYPPIAYDHYELHQGDNGAGLVSDPLFQRIFADIRSLIVSSNPTASVSFVEISAGFGHSCGRTQNGAVYCWGDNSVGQLGDGTTTDRPVPTLVAGGIRFVEISAGTFHSCGRAQNGGVYCWGRNDYGQLGDGTYADRGAPTLVTGGLSFVEISAGFEDSCGRTQSGAVYCWGRNDFGELGDGTTTEHATPTLVTGGLSFLEISAGGVHSCGRTQNGAVYCWGVNIFGELGDGTTAIHRTIPTLVTGGLSFLEISAGGNHSCGRTQNGAVYCWGRNDEGELGDGTYAYRAVPTLVTGGLSFLEISASGNHSCARTQNGAVYCWGENGGGQLGDGTYANRAVPTLVTGGLSFLEISAGVTHSCARTQNGAVYCWGDNRSGELGDGTTITRLVPTLVRSP